MTNDAAKPSPLTAATLVRTARGIATRRAFARMLGYANADQIARYEQGQESPPQAVLDYCSHMVARLRPTQALATPHDSAPMHMEDLRQPTRPAP